MRLTSFILTLAIFLSGCASTPLSGNPAAKQNNASINQLNEQSIQSVDSRFKILEAILASDLKSRDLLQAKNLIWQLKFSLTEDHSRQKELLIMDQWVSESINSREKIHALEKQTRVLKTKFSQHKKALEQVRRSLVSE